MKASVAQIKLIKDKNNKNQNLIDIYNMFNSQPNYQGFDDPSSQTKDVVDLLNRTTLFYAECGFLNGKQLLDDDMWTVERDEDEQVIPVTSVVSIETKREGYLSIL